MELANSNKNELNQNFEEIDKIANEFQAPQFYEKCGFKLEFKRENKSNPKLTKYF